MDGLKSVPIKSCGSEWAHYGSFLSRQWVTSRRQFSGGGGFGGEQLAFALEAPVVAGEAAILSDHAMAGDDHGQGIRADGGADRARRSGPAERAGDGRIGAGLAARDLLERLP